MTVIIAAAYSGTYANTHARIAHSNNWITGGTVTASSTATDYFADGPDTSLTYEKWKPSSVTAQWELAFTSQSFDYCVIGAHTMGTNGNTLQVQQYDSGAWSNLIGGGTAITDDSPIMCLFASTTDTKARIRVTNGTAPEIGIIKFGTILEMPRPFYGGHAPFDMARQTTMRSNNSSTGEFLGRTKLRTAFQTGCSWSNLEMSWIRTNWPSLQTAVEEEPIFIASRPSNTDFGAVLLAYVDDMPIPETQGMRTLASVGLNLTGYGYG